MRTFLTTVFTALAVLTVATQLNGADDQLKSGPASGEVIGGPFHYRNVNGAHADSPHCLVCEYGLEPVVAVFSRTLPDTGKPISKLMEKLDEATVKYAKARLHVFGAFLSDDFVKEETRKEPLSRVQLLANPLKAAVLTYGPVGGPEEWKLNKDAEVTVVLYFKHQVAANFSFAKDKLEEKDVDAIMAAVDKMVGAKK